KDKTVRLESHCACCFTPVTLVSRNFELQSVTPPGIFLHISLSPYDWNNVDMSRMCDSMNYVLDADHSEHYERQTAPRGILVNLDQAKMFVQNVANERMYNFHWKPGTFNPRAVTEGFQMMGVDTSAWEWTDTCLLVDSTLRSLRSLRCRLLGTRNAGAQRR